MFILHLNYVWQHKQLKIQLLSNIRSCTYLPYYSVTWSAKTWHNNDLFLEIHICDQASKNRPSRHKKWNLFYFIHRLYTTITSASPSFKRIWIPFAKIQAILRNRTMQFIVIKWFFDFPHIFRIIIETNHLTNHVTLTGFHLQRSASVSGMTWQSSRFLLSVELWCTIEIKG